MKKNDTFAIGVDFGGTNIVAGLVSSKGKVIFNERVKTDAHLGRNSILDRIEEAIRKVIDRIKAEKKIGLNRVKGIGIGSPGLVNHVKGTVCDSPNLPGWQEMVPLKQIMEKRFKMPVYVANDANAYALGEHTFGAGKGADNMICITLGTGLGGGLILNGKLYVGTFQSAGELGHIVVEKNGIKCGCKNDGCVEAYVGNARIVQRAVKYVKSGKRSLITKLVNGDLDKVTPKTITDAAKRGDKVANLVWKDTGEYIGTALSSFINILSPKIIVIGGGVSQAGELLFKHIRRETNRRVFDSLKFKVKIVPGKLKDDAGVLGSASLVWHHF